MALSDSDDLAGLPAVGHNRHPGCLPGLHAARQVHGVVAPLEQCGGGPFGASTNPTDGHNRLVLVETVDARRQSRQRDVNGIGGVTGLPFVGFADIEEHGPFVDATSGLLGTHGGDGGLALHTPKL